MDSIIRDAVVEHLQIHNLIKTSQHGFMKGRSCLTNLLVYLDKITTYIDEGLPFDAIYLDFSKAFDRVLQSRLAMKLNAHGIGGDADDIKLFSWITSSKEIPYSTHRWSVEWLMLFNAEKCKCVHRGHNNWHYDYFMGEDPIQTSNEEKRHRGDYNRQT